MIAASTHCSTDALVRAVPSRRSARCWLGRYSRWYAARGGAVSETASREWRADEGPGAAFVVVTFAFAALLAVVAAPLVGVDREARPPRSRLYRTSRSRVDHRAPRTVRREAPIARLQTPSRIAGKQDAADQLDRHRRPAARTRRGTAAASRPRPSPSGSPRAACRSGACRACSTGTSGCTCRGAPPGRPSAGS